MSTHTLALIAIVLQPVASIVWISVFVTVQRSKRRAERLRDEAEAMLDQARELVATARSILEPGGASCA